MSVYISVAAMLFFLHFLALQHMPEKDAKRYVLFERIVVWSVAACAVVGALW